MHKYQNFDELCLKESPDAFDIICCSVDSDIGIIAPRGGKIESSTSEIAAKIAGHDYNLYRLEGRKRNNNRYLHITSSRFDEPKALALVAKCDQVVVVHGCKGKEHVVYLGGLDDVLKHAIRDHLKAKRFKTDVHPDPRLQGSDRSNICNRSLRACGVQLEISRGLRLALIAAVPSKGHPTLAAFAKAVRGAIETNRGRATRK
jgi:phage replication-related protein YjqB (UPF0714/DUF867 family)